MDLSKLEGLITEETGEALRRLASNIDQEQAIVEIGSYKGKSTCYLATGAKEGEGSHVYAIDAWDLKGNNTGRFGFAKDETFEEFEKQLRKAKVKSYVTSIRSFSTDAGADWDGGEIGLLFIDGDHSRHAVRADFHAFADYLIPGHSLVLFDDYSDKNPGVVEAVDQDLIQYLSHSKIEAPGLLRTVFEGK